MKNLEKDFDDIFLTVAGELEEELPWVRAVSGGGENYEHAWQEIDDAKAHLCERFGMDWEDGDLERILNAVAQLERDVGKRMFLCGVEYAKRQE